MATLSLARRTFILAAVALIATDYGCQLTDWSVASLGPLDESAHLLTMLFVLWALGCRLDRPFAKAALVTSMAIDVDHIPQYLGWSGLTKGTPRPYTHSLLTILILLGVALVASYRSVSRGGARWPGLSQIMSGLAVGVGVHFCRDMTEPASGVSLLWPISYHSFNFQHWTYVIAMAALATVCLVRLARMERPALSRDPAIDRG